MIQSAGSPGGGAAAVPAGGLVLGDDGKLRCAWGSGDPLYVDYHDHEWGRPLRDERALFELMCLEAFQSGLSWLLILRKRPGFREAFHGFDPEVVGTYGAADVERLLSDSRIVRNRAKIEAAIANAAAVVALHEQGETLVDLVFSHAPAPDERPPGRFATMAEIPSSTAASRALAKDLRARGFRFVGPVVGYSLMEAAGVVDDHLEGCWAGE
ncbi:MAG TPA: DNA-3-methyladenine glycosylase I [Acidimicrobiales bacterium]|nr:DNA-3-methyladenine glycosylase I [Acidimicrobiales bacterium]